MSSKRDMVKIIYIVLMIIYILYRYFSIEIYNINYGKLDMLVLYSIPLYIWYINCYKNFAMTTERLKKYPFNSPLEYCTYEYKNYPKKRKIYVRVPNTELDSYMDNTLWYELDYDKTISKDSYLSEYNKFIRNNSTVGKLQVTMNNTSGNCFKDVNYKFFKIASFIAIVGLIFIHMLCTVK